MKDGWVIGLNDWMDRYLERQRNKWVEDGVNG